MENLEVKTYLELKEFKPLINFSVFNTIKELSLSKVNIEDLKAIAISTFFKVKKRKENKRVKFSTILVNRIKYDIIDHLRKEYNLNKIEEIYRENNKVNILDFTEKIDNKIDLKLSLNKLPKREKKVIELYFIKGLNLKEIGEALNLTESRISQLRKKALNSLKKELI